MGMLVLTRKSQELVEVRLPDGRPGWVSVCDIRKESVRIGFDFPLDVRVRREEVPDDQAEHTPPTVFGPPVPDSPHLVELFRAWWRLHLAADEPSTSSREAIADAKRAEDRLWDAMRFTPDGIRDVALLTPEGWVIRASPTMGITYIRYAVGGLVLLPADAGGPS